ncbi:MAG: N-acetylmuramoyl-L-alanine amidase [Bdellovibrionales bacterium]|jgi:hypothetical protein
MTEKIRYNTLSSKRYGWKPSWFGANDFDNDLIEKIVQFQKSLGLEADGLCGPSTYRRIYTHREANIDDYEPKGEHIVYNGEFFPIKWDKVVTWDEAGGLRLNKDTYNDYSGKEPRDISMFVNHWDVCLNSKSCASVLNKRKVSVHFCIDNDGTIYQLIDMQHRAWHAGNSIVNTKSVGVEISNAFYTKYQDWYTKRHGPRPVVSDAVVHGRTLETHLGFYPVQLEALKALWKAVHEACGVPLSAPMTPDGLDTGVNLDVSKGRFSGFFNHYNITSKKIDCAGLQIDKMLEDIK